MSYHDSQFARIVSAIGDRESLYKVEVWSNELLHEWSPLPRTVIAGSKSELVEKRKLLLEEGQVLAKRLGARFFEVFGKAELSIHQMMRRSPSTRFSTSEEERATKQNSSQMMRRVALVVSVVRNENCRWWREKPASSWSSTR
jgi:hypothetical protein